MPRAHESAERTPGCHWAFIRRATLRQPADGEQAGADAGGFGGQLPVVDFVVGVVISEQRSMRVCLDAGDVAWHTCATPHPWSVPLSTHVRHTC